jgi:hypothetical protein
MRVFIERRIRSYSIRLAAFVLSVIASVGLWIVPVYSGTVTATDAGLRTRTFESHARFIEVNGARGAILLVLAPLLLAVPLVVKRAKFPVAVLTFVAALAASFTIGMFYLPSAILLLLPEQRHGN